METKSDQSAVANFIHQNRENILARWEKLTREKVPSAQKQSSIELRDLLVEFLEVLEKTLKETDFFNGEIDFPGARPAQDHAHHRASTEGYSIDNVIKEYLLLERTIIKLLDERDFLSVNILRILNQVTQRSILIAAGTFSDSIRKLKQKVTSSLIHDLRSPLQVAKNYLELGEASNQPAEKDEAVKNARQALSRVEHMLTEVLNVASLEGGDALAIEFKETDIAPTIKKTLNEAKMTYNGKLNIDFKADEIKGRFAVSALTRLLENLVSNAAKYGAKDKGIDVLVKDEPSHVKISVHNWGSPIPEEEQKAMFKSFQRSKDAMASNKEGWGMGLSLVEAVALAHDGKVELESNKEKGTTFSVILSKTKKKRKTVLPLG